MNSQYYSCSRALDFLKATLNIDATGKGNCSQKFICVQISLSEGRAAYNGWPSLSLAQFVNSYMPLTYILTSFRYFRIQGLQSDCHNGGLLRASSGNSRNLYKDGQNRVGEGKGKRQSCLEKQKTPQVNEGVQYDNQIYI